LTGIGWGLPTLLHPDEGVVVNPALSMVENRTFEPNIFWHPNHFGVQITILIYRVLVWFHRIQISDVRLLGTEILYRHVILQNDNTAHLGAHGLGWGGNVWFYVSTYLNASSVLLLIPSIVGCYVIYRQRFRGVCAPVAHQFHILPGACKC